MANDVKYNIEDLASMTTPALTDLLLEARGTASYKLLISDLAKAIVENYAGSSLAGSAQSIKSALDSLNSSITNLHSLAYVDLPTSGTYSDSALYTALKNNSSIETRRFCFFNAVFTGGARFGICYLYETTKEYGMIMVFRYGLAPRFLTVNEGTATLKNWDAS